MLDRFEERAHAVLVRHVRHGGMHARQFGGQRGQARFVHVAHENRGAGVVEHLGHLQSQTIRAGGDQDPFSGEIDFLEHASVSWVLWKSACLMI
ncbi:hypothetical protein D3C87_1777900 [compost metagenome]